MRKHKHHVLPSHMGGGDEPENIVELTIQEHADAHRVLYEQHGHWQDLVAWKGLLGLVTTEECRFIAMSEGGKKGRVAQVQRAIEKHGKDYKTINNWKRNYSEYAPGIDGRKVRSKRFWFNDGTTEGQFAESPEGWKKGRLASSMRYASKSRWK